MIVALKRSVFLALSDAQKHQFQLCAQGWQLGTPVFYVSPDGEVWLVIRDDQLDQATADRMIGVAFALGMSVPEDGRIVPEEEFGAWAGWSPE